MDKKEYIERQEVCSEINELPLTEDAAMEILWAIDHIPTADVMPVVHGYWINIENKTAIKCSACSHIFDRNIYGFGFCPVCGAKMDMGGEDNG